MNRIRNKRGEMERQGIQGLNSTTSMMKSKLLRSKVDEDVLEH